MKKVVKRLWGILLAVVMTVTMVPAFASTVFAAAADPITVTMTVSFEGALAQAKDGSLMANREVTVTDLNEDGQFTFDEAMIAAEAKYDDPSGLEISDSGWTDKLWGKTNGGLYFFGVNNIASSELINATPIAEGDYLVASVNKDGQYYNDFFTKFDDYTTEVREGDTATFTLSGFAGMSLSHEFAPLSGISVKCIDLNGAAPVLKTTDENGQVKFTFEEKGQYILTAEGNVAGSVVTNWGLMDLGGNPKVYGTMDSETYESTVAYTDEDYGNGPYPADEVKYIDFFDWMDLEDEDPEAFEAMHVLHSNQLTTSSPIIAPACVIKIVDGDTEEAIDAVRTKIKTLSVDPLTYKADDKEEVEAIWDEYKALTTRSQGILDEEVDTTLTSQPLGRILESALWAVYSLEDVDNSTSLSDGVYSATSTPAITSTSSKGKSTSSRPRNWTVKDLTVTNGKAVGTLMVDNTDSMTGVWIGGETYPRTGGVESSVTSEKTSEFANVPIDLNCTFYFGGISSSMPSPTMYSMTTSIEEPTLLTIDNQVSMFNVARVTIAEKEGGYNLHLTMGTDSFTKVFVGYAGEAKDEEAIPIENRNIDIPLDSVDGDIVLAFYSKNNEKYYNRTLNVDLNNKVALFTPTQISLEKFDSMTEEEAIARAAADTSVPTVNALIEAIQVQTRDENTDKYCAIAKAYYDALSKSDKAKLDDPDYFGLDTGNAADDDPRNTAPTKEKEILVVSFGTSFNDSRVEDIKAIEDAVAAAYPEWDVRRAFTAQIIINHVQARDGEKINNMDQALQNAVDAGVKELIVQPTHLMQGAEYDELVEAVTAYQNKFDYVTVAKPLLGEVGAETATTNADKAAVAEAVVNAANVPADTALVLMGHGTSHTASITYNQMQAQMNELGYNNVFIGTVEGIPENTALPAVKKAVEDAGFKKVVLRPLMVVAGDHANNDMAADEEGSWYYGFVNGGEFEVEGADEAVDIGAGFGEANVTNQIEGLGRIVEVQQLYVSHTSDAMAELSEDMAQDAESKKDEAEEALPAAEADETTKAEAAAAAQAAADADPTNPELALAALEAKAAAAEAKATRAELEKDLAEAEATIAKAAQIKAEAEKGAAEAAKARAEAAQAAAEAAQAAAEAEKAAAEREKAAAEAKAKAAEAKAKAAEAKANAAVTAPAKVKAKSLKAAKKALTVKWNKVADAKGYEIQVATNKKFTKNLKTVTVKKGSATSKKITKLKGKKKYFVRVRAYKNVAGGTVYGKWSKTLNKKTK